MASEPSSSPIAVLKRGVLSRLWRTRTATRAAMALERIWPLALPMALMVLWRSGDHVTGQTTHDSALQAAPGFGLSEAGDGGESNNRSNRQRTHRVSPS